MPTSTKDARRLTGYRGDTDTNHAQHPQQHHYNQQGSLYDDDMEQDYQHYHENDDVYDEYDEDLDDVVQDIKNKNNNNDDDEDEEGEGDDTGSELSIPDPNIDFDMVYALHTFAATVEGQVSVVRGDALTLLDDSNSYWWLVKVLKTAEVGYIPAENIETPHERLARLNSHRNIELTRKDIQDAFPNPPSNNKIKKTKRVTLAKGVQFQSQIIFGGDSENEDDFFEAEFEQWNERMRSDDSSSDSSDDSDDQDIDDPYNYYDDNSHRQLYVDQPLAAPQHAQQQQHPTDSYNNNATNKQHQHQDPVNYYNDHRLSGDSDILNDRDMTSGGPSNRDTLNLSDETIKISLTPSIARGYGDDHRTSDSSIQSKLKKAAKLEKLLSSPEPIGQPSGRRGSKDSNSKEKKEKSGIRKFFSRSNSKDSKKKNGGNSNGLERQLSGESQVSISSQSTGSFMDRDRQGSLDSTIMLAAASGNNRDSQQQQQQQQQHQEQQQQATKLKIHAGNIGNFSSPQGMMESYKFVPVYPTTTATELIHMALHDQYQLHDENITYHDYYLIVRTLGGDEFTLVPSDKPLEIYYSLTSHKVTPMPSLKKARRISQLMGNDLMGGPSKDPLAAAAAAAEDEVSFYLLSKTKRIEDGEIQIKVSLFPSTYQLQHGEITKRVDKLVKIPTSIVVKDAVTLLLEKFHILNGIVANRESDIKSLRLEAEDDIVKYHLALNRDGQEHLLDLEDKLINVFGEGDQMPQIHYRRNSNPDRTSITVNITPPEKNELYFILKCVETRRKKAVEQAPVFEEPQEMIVKEEPIYAHQEQQQQQQQQHHHHHHHQRPIRHDTPMPARQDHHKPTHQPSLPPQPYQPQLYLADSHEESTNSSRGVINASPTISNTNELQPPILSSSPMSSSEDILSQLDEAIDTLNNKKASPSTINARTSPQTPQPQQTVLNSPKSPPIQQRTHRQSTESMLFVNDFGMNDLMVMIRGAAAIQKQMEEPPNTMKRGSQITIRNEISEVFKDSQTRLDQLEKELDRLMSEAVKVYN